MDSPDGAAIHKILIYVWIFFNRLVYQYGGGQVGASDHRCANKGTFELPAAARSVDEGGLGTVSVGDCKIWYTPMEPRWSPDETAMELRWGSDGAAPDWGCGGWGSSISQPHPLCPLS